MSVHRVGWHALTALRKGVGVARWLPFHEVADWPQLATPFEDSGTCHPIRVVRESGELEGPNGLLITDEALEVRASHASIGGAPGMGDKPNGYLYYLDVLGAIQSDQFVRERAIAAGVPVSIKTVSQYGYPETEEYSLGNPYLDNP